MTEMFKMEIRLDSQSMTEFGSYVSAICCQFPALVLAETEALAALLSATDPDPVAIGNALSNLAEQARIAVKIGDGVATVIGTCTPQRMDGGPVQ